MTYFNDDDYGFTEGEISAGITALFYASNHLDSEDNVIEMVDKSVINTKLIKIIGSTKKFEDIKEYIVKQLIKNRLYDVINLFIINDANLNNFELIHDSKGVVALVKYILRKNNVEISEILDARINLMVNGIINNISLNTLYERVATVQRFIHEQISFNGSIADIDSLSMYKILTTIRVFLNISDVNKMNFHGLVNLEKKNRVLINERIKKENDLIFDKETREFDREIFSEKYPHKKYNPRHPVSKNMESFYSFILEDNPFKIAMYSLLQIDEHSIYTQDFYRLLCEIEAKL